jgi:hypothetical protein
VFLCVAAGVAAGAVSGAVALRWDGRYPEYALLVAAGMAAIGALGTAAVCDALTLGAAFGGSRVD